MKILDIMTVGRLKRWKLRVLLNQAVTPLGKPPEKFVIKVIYRRISKMGCCINHADRQTHFICQKHQIHLCEECLECRDPQLYCKFRSSCMIWFVAKQKKKAV